MGDGKEVWKSLKGLSVRLSFSSWHMLHSLICPLRQLARAHGPSLGTTICSAFLLTPLRTIYTFASLLRKTTVLPKAFTFLNPLLNYLNGALEMFNGWVLAYTGLTGDGFWESAKKVKTLIRGNGTKGLGESWSSSLVLCFCEGGY